MVTTAPITLPGRRTRAPRQARARPSITAPIGTPRAVCV
jgi:hypothetical protein